MLKDITTIKLQGASFSTLSPFVFFNPHEKDKVKIVKSSLLYGRNGTGKSTIARAFYKIAGGDVASITSASLYDDAGQPVVLTEDEKKHIFVFNEEYVDRNVRLQPDHLDTIVMLGQAADLTEKIEKAENERDAAKIILEQKENIYNEYQSASNPKSPKYHLSLIVNALRGDDNWAGRDREINDSRQNTSVKDDTYTRFVRRKPTKTKTELISAYKTKLKELDVARKGNNTIDTPVPSLPVLFSKYDDDAIFALLNEKIEKPELSDREKKLFTLLQTNTTKELDEKLKVFKNVETTACPYCYQPLSKEYKLSIISGIETVLNKVVEGHRTALEKHIYSLIYLDLSSYSKIEGYQTCVDFITAANSAIQINNERIQKKIDNPYETIIVEKSNVSVLLSQLKKAISDLEKARCKYNLEARKTAPIIKELNEINSDIAYYDVITIVAQYEVQKIEEKKAFEEYNTAKNNFDAKLNVVTTLESQRQNITLALDSINACLNYIFFSENRLKIECIDGKYRLLSHGKQVEPRNVSVGERNAIGLSYFFVSILEGKEEEKAYNEEYLLILDDPISSFDTENRIGILSFLKYKLGVFLENNKDTKAIIMTHDLATAYDLQKILDEILDVCKQKGWQQGLKYNRLEFQNGSFVDFINKRQEYTELLKAVYVYATGQADPNELVIGNMMRQVLEAFATFQYKKGIEDVSNDEQILALLPEPCYAQYYRNLMYRLVLHSGSHREDQIKTMKDYNFFSLISEVEKRRTARDILCFIYLLNKRHILEHLANCSNAEADIQSWCHDIKTKANTM